ncbi:hypothetical protein GWC77_21645 [Paraburkholderia sp. NMBU_R16]|uniref:hypothetical protein n=1 Tax=Paraburkholderia sp. NMBU_R16 TaxID=2698676 RepID=UPI001565211B|nr:hypothetical protein [Paraburkholderia sp. NMBU_R16]NRO98532.1 hypothetical protein [Paraburkholderia sp. NMBU_R16]
MPISIDGSNFSPNYQASTTDGETPAAVSPSTVRALGRHGDAPRRLSDAHDGGAPPIDGETPGTMATARFAHAKNADGVRAPDALSSAAPLVIRDAAALKRLREQYDGTEAPPLKLEGYFGPGELQYLPEWVGALDLSECRGLRHADLEGLSSLRLTALDVSGHPIGQWKAAPTLAQLGTLTSLTACGCGLDDADMKSLVSLPALTSAMLGNNRIGYEGIATIFESYTLRRIDVSRNEFGTLGALSIAQDPVSREWVDVSGNHIGIIGEQALRERQANSGVSIIGIGAQPKRA